MMCAFSGDPQIITQEAIEDIALTFPEIAEHGNARFHPGIHGRYAKIMAQASFVLIIYGTELTEEHVIQFGIMMVIFSH